MKRVGITETPTLIPDGGEEETRELNSVTRVNAWGGSYEKLKRMRPVEGTLDKSGYAVMKTALKKKPAGQGLLTIYYTKIIVRQPEFQSAVAVRDVIRVRWERIQRPLRLHPKFQAIGDATTWAAVDAWEKEDDAELKGTYKYRVPLRDPTTNKWLHDENNEPLYDVKDVSASLHKYCLRRLNGVDSYDTFRPIVSRVRVYARMPTPGGLGTAPATAPIAISGFEFMKTEDSLTDEGRKNYWVQTESWEGATEYDTLLYGTEGVV